MRIRLDSIAEEPFTWEETLSIPTAELERSDLVALSPVELAGSIRRSEGGLRLVARLDYRQTVSCDRCLAGVELPVRADLDLWLETAEPHELPPDMELEEDDLGILYVPGEVLDTEPLAREQVQLNLPMKPLCRPDCQGLCPRCGADLNEAACACDGAETDPRWAALEALRGRLE